MKQGVYNVDEFLTSFHNKSPIYYDVYKYLRMQRVGLDDTCLELRRELFNDGLDLESYYDRTCKSCQARMNIAVAWWAEQKCRLTARYAEFFSCSPEWDEVKERIAAPSADKQTFPEQMVELHEIVALMKYVYIELQWPLLLGNAILNKVFFEELITEKLSMMSEKTGISLLELLMLLDNSTEHRYTIAPQGVDTYTEIEACLGSAADDFMVLSRKFSLQKHSERRFNQTFESWSPMIIDMRDSIGCYLERFNICRRQDLVCMPIYDLLPLMDNEYLPKLYLR